MSVRGHSQLCLKDHGDWGMFLRTGKKEMSLLSSGRAGQIQPHLNPRESDVASKSGNHFEIYEGQEGD